MEPTIGLVALITVLSAIALYEFYVRERLIGIYSRSAIGKPASALQRIGLAIIVSASCWLLTNQILIESFPASRDLQPYADRAVLGFALTFGWLVWSRSKRAPHVMLSRAIAGAAILGGFAFAISALSGPLLFPTKYNQGVLMGLVFIGPAFAILGGVGSLLVWSIRDRSEPA